MAPQQGTPSGVPYSRRLFEHADVAWSLGVPLTETFVKSLWKVAIKGGRLSWGERRTLEYIREEYNLSVGAKAMLEERVVSHFSRTIHGKRYDKGILDEAARRARSGRLGKPDLVDLWRLANDMQGATAMQVSTFDYILQQHRLSLAARLFLVAQLRTASRKTSPVTATERPKQAQAVRGACKRGREGALEESACKSCRTDLVSSAGQAPLVLSMPSRWSFLSQIWQAIAAAATRCRAESTQ